MGDRSLVHSCLAPSLLFVTLSVAACGPAGGCEPGRSTPESPTTVLGVEREAKPPATKSNEPPAADHDGNGGHDGDGGNVTVARPEPIEPAPSEEAIEAYSGAVNGLGIELLRRVPEKGNLVLSPASVHTAVLMAWLGAEGQTRAELGRALGIEGGSAPEKVVATLLREWNNPALANVELRVVNRIFGDHALEAKQAYQQVAERFFAAPLDRVDFKDAPELSRTRINGWVAGQTNDRIENLIPPGIIDDQTRAVLVNAAYLLAEWQEPFEEEATRAATFFAPGGPKQVPTMHRVGSLRYGEMGDVSLLELPYKNGRFAMLIVLPKSKKGLSQLEAQLSGARLRAMVEALETQRVEVALPKFEIAGDVIPLKAVFRQLGVEQAFERFRADFTRITDPADPEDRLSISEILHKGFVRVDERGTEAAAASAVVMMGAGGVPADPQKFIADHPFLFALRDVSSGAILFLGRVTDPAA